MWIITKSGFISAVQHDKNSELMRVRARKIEHLQKPFPHLKVVDFGEKASDYRYHCDVPRDEFAAWLLIELDQVDYTSHAKEAMSGDDHEFYSALMGCWGQLAKIQPGFTRPVSSTIGDWDDEDWEDYYGGIAQVSTRVDGDDEDDG